jgi:gas vesicle protein
MLRIFLVIAVIAGLAGLFGAYQAGEKIRTISSDRDQAREAADASKAAENKAKADAKKSKDEADKAKTDLTTAVEDLKATATRLVEQERRAADLETRLAKSEQDKTRAQQDLSAWAALGIPIEQIKAVQARLRKVVEERDAFGQEKQVLARALQIVEAELRRYKGETTEVKLPANLQGKVVSVDPQYQFVVLDLGRSHGLLERGKLAVSREGKMVAQVRVMKLEANRAVANILPETKQADVAAGDSVFTSYEALAQKP